MNRLVFFGDSFTYGHGLDDCLLDIDNQPGPNPSKLGWAAQLSESLGLPNLNRSVPGSSNQHMFLTMRMTELSKDDIVIVQWTYDQRDIIMEDDSSVLHVGNWINHPKVNGYIQVHGNLDMNRRTLLTIEHAALWLSYRGIKWMFLSNWDINGVGDLITDNEGRVWTMSGKDLAKDGNHPGLIANSAWAKVVENHFYKSLKRPTQDIKVLVS
jgi:hypothetical protein